jgi:myo-inositol-1(or 4)-monophosphatase
MSLEKVEALLRDIGRYQLEGYRKLEQADVQVKDSSGYGKSVVTEYDLESERRVRRFIDEHFPRDSFLGEESGNVRRDRTRYWLLDPIDGTTNFTQGVAYWGPTLCLCDAEGPREGWIFMPAVDQMFHARRGGGAFLNGQRLHASKATEYSKLTSIATTSSLHNRYQLTVPAKQRILGSLVVNLAYLATGTFVACFCRANVWDVAAGILIAREAGAVVDCRPAFESIDLAALEPGKTSSLTIFGQANKSLPSLEEYLLPIQETVR